MAWIPKKPTVEAIHASVDASTDASIKDWAKPQYDDPSSSSEESTKNREVPNKNSKRKESTKQNNKTTAKITQIDDEDNNYGDSCERPNEMTKQCGGHRREGPR